MFFFTFKGTEISSSDSRIDRSIYNGTVLNVFLIKNKQNIHVFWAENLSFSIVGSLIKYLSDICSLIFLTLHGEKFTSLILMKPLKSQKSLNVKKKTFLISTFILQFLSIIRILLGEVGYCWIYSTGWGRILLNL